MPLKIYQNTEDTVNTQCAKFQKKIKKYTFTNFCKKVPARVGFEPAPGGPNGVTAVLNVVYRERYIHPQSIDYLITAI